MLLYVWGLAHVVRKGKKPFFHTPSYVERTEAFSLPFSKKKKLKKLGNMLSKPVFIKVM